MTRLGPSRITRASYGGESSMRYYAYVTCQWLFALFLLFCLRLSDARERSLRVEKVWAGVGWKSRGKVFYFFLFFDVFERRITI